MFFLRELLKTYFLFIAIFFTTRVILFAIFFGRFSEFSLSYAALTFLYGLRMDTIVVAIILTIPTIILALSPKIFSKISSKFVSYYILVFLLVAIFIESATFPFFFEYDLRPNYLFIEYLEYPKEVGDLLFKDYKLEIIFATFLMLIAYKLYVKTSFLRFEEVFKTTYIKRLSLLLPVLLLLFVGIRSSFAHRPANISDALFSTNRILNEVTKNSLYSLGYAYYSNKRASSNINKYGKIDIDEAYSLVSNALNISYTDKQKPFNREVKTNFKYKEPKNLVIIVEESLGAQFTGFIGDTNLTPNIDLLAKNYLSFTNLYSNGTRSIRGLAALSSGTLPLVGEEVLKRNKSQNDFFTVASLLKPFGYKSSFIYGGEARFDNMRSWYMGNGFDEIIEEKDYKNPTFKSTWGVSDEDLMIKANEVFKEYAKKDEKFVSVVFSSSNHMPFELPDGKIEFEKDFPKNSVQNAIKYADFSIGRFFELAKQENYYKDTVFVVVADHNVRVYGDEVVPINMFHIPAVIVSQDIKPQVFTKLTSQPDVLATALDLIGLDLSYPILGNSLFNDGKKEVNLMLFDETFAYRKKEKVAILVPNLAPQTYIYENSRLKLIENDLTLEKEALALVYVIDDMYNKKLYR